MPSVDARRGRPRAELLEAGEGARGGAFGRRREYLRLARRRVRRPEAVATIGAGCSRARTTGPRWATSRTWCTSRCVGARLRPPASMRPVTPAPALCRSATASAACPVSARVWRCAYRCASRRATSMHRSWCHRRCRRCRQVSRLGARCAPAGRPEARGDYDAAEKVYADLLEKDKTNADAMKRRAALARARSGPIEAIKRLNEYLENYAADQEAWAELAELYLELSMYKQAAFCLEELVLAAPHEQKRHLRYAEVLYTMGGAENVLAAKRYFAAAVELGGGHGARALYGLAACAQALAAPGMARRSAEEPSSSLAANRIKSLYRQADSPHAEMVADVLTSLGCYDKPKGGARSADDETTSAMTT